MMIAIDLRYGRRVNLRGVHPRKELCEALGRQHCERMYVNTEKGTMHVGYIVDGGWWELYERREVKVTR